MNPAILLEESSSPSKLSRAMNDMADPANLIGRADLHSALRHVHRRPELELIAVRIGEVNHGSLFTLGRSPDRIGMRNFMAIETAQMCIDLLRTNVKAAAWQIFAECLCRREQLGLKKRTDTARSTLPPQERSFIDIFVPGSGRESDQWLPGEADSVNC